jgi:hypothetical protein
MSSGGNGMTASRSPVRTRGTSDTRTLCLRSCGSSATTRRKDPTASLPGEEGPRKRVRTVAAAPEPVYRLERYCPADHEPAQLSQNLLPPRVSCMTLP